MDPYQGPGTPPPPQLGGKHLASLLGVSILLGVPHTGERHLRGDDRALQPVGPLAKTFGPHQLLTLEGAEPLWRPWKQIMVGAMSPFQKRLLLHICVSSTVTSSSCSVGESPPCLRTPQPARLHSVPAAGTRPSSPMSRRVLLSVTFPSSCGQGRQAASDPPPRPERGWWGAPHCSGWAAEGERRAGAASVGAERCHRDVKVLGGEKRKCHPALRCGCTVSA